MRPEPIPPINPVRLWEWLQGAFEWLSNNVFGVVVVILLVAVALVVKHARDGIVRARDDKRVFTKQEREEMFARAGGRCEHKPLLGRRCTEVPTHGDHIYPWSRGGATTMDNAQALCARHNGIKSAWVPTLPYIKRLERRRRSYFPAGEDTRVWWHQDSPPPWRMY